jgi:DNA helicase-2/ATP-dependent DNA helicase PcrA
MFWSGRFSRQGAFGAYFSRTKRAAKTSGKIVLPGFFFSSQIFFPAQEGVRVKIARLIGGAGTGKTTELLRIMEGALPKLGNDPLRLGFASFTRAARAEAVGRASSAWNVPPSLLEVDGWFRTVHSTCKRCLKIEPGQLLGDTQKDLEWISNVLGVKLATELDDEIGRQRFIGDHVVAASLNCWGLAKNSLLPLEEVVRRMRRIDDDVPDFAAIVRVTERYEMAKRLEDRLDFADLLLRFAGIEADPMDGVRRVEPEGDLPPVEAWLFDEQQDASPLLDAVCSRLVSAPSVKWCYVVGDPFQAIYGFAGSSADCFLGWQAEKERTMPKSYRCPKPVLELGERCLRRMSRGYFDRSIAAADHDGSVNEADGIDSIISTARPDEDWLFIARSNYHASRMYAALHAAYKPCRWVKSPEGVTNRGDGLRALYTLEHNGHVSGAAWGHAVALLPPSNKDREPILTRGTKTRWAKEHADEWDVIFKNDLPSVGAEPALIAAIESGEWCRLVDRGFQWRQQANQWGAELAASPKIRVGTIHSVKGAEADNVAFLTTIGSRVEQGMENPEQADEEHRIAYVAVTRTRRNLYVVNEGKHGKRVPRMEVL